MTVVDFPHKEVEGVVVGLDKFNNNLYGAKNPHIRLWCILIEKSEVNKGTYGRSVHTIQISSLEGDNHKLY